MNQQLTLKVGADLDLEEIGKLSTANLIVLIVGLSEIKSVPLTAEDIVVECWLLSPLKHSLRGYPQFPDSNTVLKRLADMKGRNGLIDGSWRSGFKLTQRSRVRLDEIMRDISTKNVRAFKMPNADDRTVSSIDEAPYKRLTRTPAYKKFMAGEVEKIVESDFLYFYGISWNSKRPYIEGKIKNVDLVISKFAEKDPVLQELNEYLNTRFKKIKESI